MTLTTAQMTDVRRFAGYQAYGTTEPLDANTDTVFVVFGMVTMSLYTRLTSLIPEEEAVLTTVFLPNLNALELAIPASGANLDTDSAAVWKHNRDEVTHRTELLDQWAIRMCNFLGITPGPALDSGGGSANVKIQRA